jgi:hypothetical protein
MRVAVNIKMIIAKYYVHCAAALTFSLSRGSKVEGFASIGAHAAAPTQGISRQITARKTHLAQL